MTITRVGIVGGGPLAEAFARALARADVMAVIGEDDSTGESPRPISGPLETPSLKTTLGTAAEEDVVFLSARWAELAETLARIADWEGRILIDATNPTLSATESGSIGSRTSSEIVRDLSPGAQLVKAFNAIPLEALAAGARPDHGKSVIFFSGDHLRAKVEVHRLVEHMGFAGIDLGGLVPGGRLLQFPDGALWGRNLVSFSP